ncbi:MAG: hypothetical protein NT161_00300 [Candidatus Nomurabacteria bacterium]|nr:hypothetical protein [Candidatus Nomurabacteria bacterium]
MSSFKNIQKLFKKLREKTILGWIIIILLGIIILGTWPILVFVYGIYILYSNKIEDSKKIEILKECIGLILLLITLGVIFCLSNLIFGSNPINY